MMTSHKIMRYMRELGYQYKPTLSKTGKHVFRRKADSKLTKPASWAYYAEAIRKHPRYALIQLKFDKRHKPRYKALIKAGVLHPAQVRKQKRREAVYDRVG